MKKGITRKLKLDELSTLLERLDKKYGVRIRVYESLQREIWFSVTLPQEISANRELYTDGSAKYYSTFLLKKVEEIAELYEWTVNIQSILSEDNHKLVKSWCEISKKEDLKELTQEDVERLVTEASEIITKVKELTSKQRK